MSSHGVGLGPSKKGRTADASMVTRNMRIVAQGQADATYADTQKKNPFRLSSAILGGAQYNPAVLALRNLGVQAAGVPPPVYPERFTAVAMSSDGRYQTAVRDNGGIYRSENFGVNWTPTNAPDNFWVGVTMSSSGQFQTAITFNLSPDFDPGEIYRSTDFGVTWEPTSAPSDFWYSVAVSSDGQYQIADASSIWISSDAGVSWEPANAPYTNWLTVAMSSSGEYQTVGSYDAGIYRSIDSGLNWIQTSAPTTIIWDGGVAMSSNGQYQTAAAYFEGVYRSTDFGVTWSKISVVPTAN